MATEVNTFFWPGPDLAPNAAGSYQYGELPAVVFNALKDKILAAGNVSSIERTDWNAFGSELDDGWLTNRRYLKLSGANTPLTASRDLAHLEQLGIIRNDPTTDGISTRYSIALA